MDIVGGHDHDSLNGACRMLKGDLRSDVNKDWTCKDKDQAYKDQDKDKD